MDVSQQPVVPLLRGRPIPRGQQNDCYIFDPITPQELRRAHDEVRVLAVVYAANPEVVDEEIWVVAEPGHRKFGEIVPDEVIMDQRLSDAGGRRG